MSQEIAKRLLELERRMDGLNLPEVGSQPVFLDEPLTNTTFDGDSFSTVAVHTKIENTSWSTTIPTNATALIIRMDTNDEASAATPTLYFALYSTATATGAGMVGRPSGKANDDRDTECSVVPCTNGDVWYRCAASGANTLDVRLWCVGYWL